MVVGEVLHAGGSVAHVGPLTYLGQYQRHGWVPLAAALLAVYAAAVKWVAW